MTRGEADEPGRFLVILAVRGQETWQAAEVCVEEGEIVSISDMGEGVAWPWM